MTAAQRKTVRWGLGLLLLAGCPATPRPPGDEVMGEFFFHAEPDPSNVLCGLREVPTDAGFDFSATFSRKKSGEQYWVTIGGVPHEASFDGGQTIDARYSAQRTFSDCQCPNGENKPGVITMTETLVAAVMSKSQSEALGGGCEFEPPFDPDAGIVRPDSTATGFDAVQACGRLMEEVRSMPEPTAMSDDAGTCVAACNTCRLSYVISGGRK